jgi:hypothetical protein
MSTKSTALRIKVQIQHDRLAPYLLEHAEEIKARAAVGNPHAMRIERRVKRLMDSPTEHAAEKLAEAVYYYKVAVEC